MSEQDRFIPGVPNWVDLAAPDPRAAQEFYGALLGWRFEPAGDGPGGRPFSVASVEDGTVGAITQAADGTAGWNTYVLVDSAEALASRVEAAGGKVLADAGELGDLALVLPFADAQGAVLHGWEPRSRRGADVVNAHGAVNFNDLHTPDPVAAASFYGDVLGWEKLDLGEGMSMWGLAAYGEHLERRTPGMRQGMADMGAPARFEEVVASLATLAGDDPGSTPHWGVTFGVDDVEACAARAAELGGTVLAGPFDAPWVRLAVVKDLQGATFVASQFVPPGS